jgi:hypothetical protein
MIQTRHLLVLAAAIALTVYPLAAQAQSGSTGGSIGKQGKSVSGGTAAPGSKPAPKPAAATPKPKPRAAAAKPEADEGSRSPCAKAMGTWFWVTQEVTLRANGVASSPGGQGSWTCSGNQLSVFWSGQPAETFTVTADGQLTGHWFISPRRVR